VLSQGRRYHGHDCDRWEGRRRRRRRRRRHTTIRIDIYESALKVNLTEIAALVWT
jgi:hypothetical protein